MIHLFPVNAAIPRLILLQSLCKFQLLLLACVSEMACVCVWWCLKSRARTLRRGRPMRSQRDSTLDYWGFNSHDWCIFHPFCKGLLVETRVHWHYSSDLLQWCFNRPRLWVSWAGAQLLCCLVWLWEKKETPKSLFPGEGSSEWRKDWSQHSEAKLNFSWSRRRHGRGENCILAKGATCEKNVWGRERMWCIADSQVVQGLRVIRWPDNQRTWWGQTGSPEPEHSRPGLVASPFSFGNGKWVNNCILFCYTHTKLPPIFYYNFFF